MNRDYPTPIRAAEHTPWDRPESYAGAANDDRPDLTECLRSDDEGLDEYVQELREMVGEWLFIALGLACALLWVAAFFIAGREGWVL